ncbi:glycosyltransferase family 4 protein [Riemerella anatipestifer]|uniref:glycosyltransferase family 4 protein n=1 Tax=Riemerella anatipestifer TaxID=34085 RepID=UPI0016277305|nr:glycosyltransferase family 4 protein [Riemerella anatipestifer]
MTEIAKSFVGKGHLVKVITSSTHYDSNVSSSQKLEGVDFFEIKSFGGDKNIVINRIINALYTSFVLAWLVFKKSKKEDIVFAVTNPLFLVVLLAIVRKIKNFEYVLLVHDVFPENTVPVGISTKEKTIYRLLLKIYNWAYRMPSKLIVLGEDMRRLVIEKGVEADRIKIIPNWFDKELENVEVLTKSRKTDKITIGFAGNIGRVQYLEGFIKIFNEIKNTNLELVIIGEGANLESSKREANKGRGNIIFLGAKPRSEQIDFLQDFDIGLITLSEGMYGLGVPSKIYNLLAMGKPVLYIGDSNSEIDIMNKKYNIGWSFSWNEKSEIFTLLENLTVREIEKYQMTNRELAKQKYSNKIVLEQINNFVFNQ